MIALLYRLPAWLVSPDDKPSKQTFSNILSNSKSFPINAETISSPTLSTVEVQASLTLPDNFNNYNYILWAGKYYIIQDVSYVSANHNVVQIHAQIDLYLTFLVDYFDEQTTSDVPVYFKQKHLNRWVYNVNQNGNQAQFSKQFYLLAKHPALSNIGGQNIKTIIVPHNDAYCTATQLTSSQGASTILWTNNTGFYENNFSNLDPQVYPVILWNMQVQENNIKGWGSYPFPYGISAIGSSWSGGRSLYWYEIIQNVPSDYFSNLYLFPVSLNKLINTSQITGSGNMQAWVSTVADVIGSGKITASGWSDTTDYCLVGGNNQYLAIINQDTWTPQSIPDYAGVEPAILNYCKANIRMYGQDCLINLTSFNNYYQSILINNTFNPSALSYSNVQAYLLSFCLTVSPPNMTITNIPASVYNFYYTDAIIPWNYNQLNDAIFSIIMKAELPTVTSNWLNYLATSKNSYNMGLNISQLMSQNAQAQISVAQADYNTSAVTSPLSIIKGLFSFNYGGIADTITGVYDKSIGANVIAPNDASMQKDKVQYMQTGIKQDYSRVSNMRVASGSTINTLYDSTFTLIFETPPAFEQEAIINYYILYGYLLERWDLWKYWNNRKYCNYVKCVYFTNAFLSTLNAYYRGGIDDILNKGIRIWNNASFSSSYATIPYGNILINYHMNSYPNVELNENNDEVNYLT